MKTHKKYKDGEELQDLQVPSRRPLLSPEAGRMVSGQVSRVYTRVRHGRHRRSESSWPFMWSLSGIFGALPTRVSKVFCSSPQLFLQQQLLILKQKRCKNKNSSENLQIPFLQIHYFARFATCVCIVCASLMCVYKHII